MMGAYDNMPPPISDKSAWLKRLRLTDFRNFRKISLELDGRLVALIGENGAGKTNLLEAISMLAPGRGLRGAPFAELARFDGPGSWTVAARLQRGEEEIAIGTGIEADGGPRRVRIDGQEMKGSGRLGEYLDIVWLTPAMDRLFNGPASERRRFLDRLLVPLDPSFGSLARAFERAMRQRNKLLEEDCRDEAMLAAIERVMAEKGAALAAARMEGVEQLSAAIARKWPPHGSSPFPWSRLVIRGEMEDDLLTMPASEAEDKYCHLLAAMRERDRATRRTLSGPHRSDFMAIHGPSSRPASLCSTGEKKALLTGLVLAHAALLASLRGAPPIILLDEITAHLDHHRRQALFDEIKSLSSQCFMTGTEEALFSPIKSSADLVFIQEGAIVNQP